ncbi:hypothetical protein L3Q82_023481 [Scortum barcoo]|uniref:Uncharacterized protein n=1 Tax=Scortum barcoo TaxID=214431 RepID=A0ACB8WT02_9TELE|nr:hypothetical protein L3Q82_023481 [Scortum barcoo]
MKCFERLVKSFITSSLPDSLDPLQFAYRPNRSTEDAIALTLHTALSHLDQRDTYVRCCSLTTVQHSTPLCPSKLVTKLRDLGLNSALCDWILNFLMGRPQAVRMVSTTSSTLTLNTGAPQGCVLSPLLYSLFTHDCVATHSSNTIVIFADDMTDCHWLTDLELSEKNEDIEKRSRRCNVRIMGIAEEPVLSSTVSVSKLLKEVLQLEKVIIAKLHYYKDCVDVLRRARQQGPLRYRGQPIAIFPDYTASVAKARAAFNDVRNLLCGRSDVHYGILFPAHLHISYSGDTKEFQDPDPDCALLTSNNKPWITRDLKALLNKKKMAFRAGDREEQRRVQHELRDMLRTCKDNYRRKLEAKVQQNNVRDVWTGMKHITGDEGERQADIREPG